MFLTLPQPIRSYVLAHELSHALWGMAMGARVHNMRLSKDGGSVSLSRTNFLITLAPYFFPLYTVLVIVVYRILVLFWDLEPYELYWLGLVGFTWGFHVTFTLKALSQHQPDIDEHGHVFSYVVILLMNMAGICLWIVGVSHASMGEMGTFIYIHTLEVRDWLVNGYQHWMRPG